MFVPFLLSQYRKVWASCESCCCCPARARRSLMSRFLPFPAGPAGGAACPRSRGALWHPHEPGGAVRPQPRGSRGVAVAPPPGAAAATAAAASGWTCASCIQVCSQCQLQCSAIPAESWQIGLLGTATSTASFSGSLFMLPSCPPAAPTRSCRCWMPHWPWPKSSCGRSSQMGPRLRSRTQCMRGWRGWRCTAMAGRRM